MGRRVQEISVATAAFTLLLAACGQKGPLTLEDPKATRKAAQTAQAAESTPAASAASAPTPSSAPAASSPSAR